jgi:toxin HigB-1
LTRFANWCTGFASAILAGRVKGMEVKFDDDDLDRLETDRQFNGGHGQAVVKGFRKAMQALRAAADERDLRSMRGLRFKRLDPPRDHQHSMRLNDQWRLIVEITGDHPKKKVRVIAIEDYH